MTAALAIRATGSTTAAPSLVPDAGDRSAAAGADPSDAFTFADYVSLFAYDGPRRPGILASDLVTWAGGVVGAA